MTVLDADARCKHAAAAYARKQHSTAGCWGASDFPSVIPQMPRLSLLNHALL